MVRGITFLTGTVLRYCLCFQKICSTVFWNTTRIPYNNKTLKVLNIYFAVIGNQEDCVFPFRFGGKTYRNCIYTDHYRPWCAWDSEYKTLRWSNCGKEWTKLRRIICVKINITVNSVEHHRDTEDTVKWLIMKYSTQGQHLIEVFVLRPGLRGVTIMTVRYVKGD